MKNSNITSVFIIAIFLLGQNTVQAQKEKMLKISLIAPLMEHVELSYERLIKPKRSLELKLGIIGVGLVRETVYTSSMSGSETVRKVTNGFFINAGYRFYNLLNTNKKSKPLKGFYLQPDLILGRYLSQIPTTTRKETVYYQGLLANFGYQGFIGNKISFDFYVGVGMGNDNRPEIENNPSSYFGEFHRGLYKFKSGLSGAMKSGIKVGFAF